MTSADALGAAEPPRRDVRFGIEWNERLDYASLLSLS